MDDGNRTSKRGSRCSSDEENPERKRSIHLPGHRVVASVKRLSVRVLRSTRKTGWNGLPAALPAAWILASCSGGKPRGSRGRFPEILGMADRRGRPPRNHPQDSAASAQRIPLLPTDLLRVRDTTSGSDQGRSARRVKSVEGPVVRPDPGRGAGESRHSGPKPHPQAATWWDGVRRRLRRVVRRSRRRAQAHCQSAQGSVRAGPLSAASEPSGGNSGCPPSP